MCPPCKILLDDPGMLAASAMLLADTVGYGHPIFAPARYLSAVVTASGKAIVYGIDHGKLTVADIDKAHAWSELNCHRAKQLRAWAGYGPVAEKLIGNRNPDVGKLALAHIMQWAEEDRLFATDLIGGEYDSDGSGAWVVHGTEGISAKQTTE